MAIITSNLAERVEQTFNCEKLTNNTSYSIRDAFRIAEDVIRLLNQVEPILEMLFQSEQHNELKIRHHGVYDNLRHPKAYSIRSQLHPYDKINDIIDWYIEYHAALLEIEQIIINLNF